MSNLRNAYLREMGVDVWVLREHVPSNPVSIERLGGKNPLALESAPSGPVAMAQTLANSASTRVASTRPIQAPRQPALPEPSVVQAGQKSQPSQVRSKQDGLKSVGESEPEFLLCFSDYSVADQDVSCVFYLPYATPGLPIEVRRFADNVAVALFGQVTAPERSELRWPMVKAAHIPQSAVEAKQVVAVRLEQRGRQVLVFGQAAFQFFDIAPQTPIGAACSVAGKTLWPLAEVGHYFTDAEAKRRLWKTLVAIKAQAQRPTGTGHVQ